MMNKEKVYFKDINNSKISFEHTFYVMKKDNNEKINIKYQDGKIMAIPNTKQKVSISYNDEWFKDYVGLGKKIYETFPNYIDKIVHQEGIYPLRYDRLILKKDILLDENIVPIIAKWCEKYPVYFLEENLSTDQGEEYPIEVFMLIDLATFAYLVLSAFNNEYNYEQMQAGDKKCEEEYNKGNKIMFKDFMLITYKPDIYRELADILKHYQENCAAKYTPVIKDENTRNEIYSRPILQDRPALLVVNSHASFEKEFMNFYSLFFFSLKGQSAALINGTKYFRVCRCGNIIPGKAKHCEDCKISMERQRKKEAARKKREEGKIEKNEESM